MVTHATIAAEGARLLVEERGREWLASAKQGAMVGRVEPAMGSRERKASGGAMEADGGGRSAADGGGRRRPRGRRTRWRSTLQRNGIGGARCRRCQRWGSVELGDVRPLREEQLPGELAWLLMSRSGRGRRSRPSACSAAGERGGRLVRGEAERGRCRRRQLLR